jgi:ribonuclease J
MKKTTRPLDQCGPLLSFIQGWQNAFCSVYGIGMKSIHTSGHAYLEDLKRLVKALNPSVLIPVHTLAGDSFSNHFPNVVRLDDGFAYKIN